MGESKVKEDSGLIPTTPTSYIQDVRAEEKLLCKWYGMYIDFDPNEELDCSGWESRDKPLPKVTDYINSPQAPEALYRIVDAECPECGAYPIIIYETGGCVRECFSCISCGESLALSEIDELVEQAESIAGDEMFYDFGKTWDEIEKGKKKKKRRGEKYGNEN